MHLTTAQMDRACGVLLASAAGDALGAGYEFTTPPADLVPQMIGGGLGGFAPGEWTDDTAQALAIAEVAATGIDLDSAAARDAIAQRFADWYADDPADVGIQTSAVLRAAGRTPSGESMRAAAQGVHDREGRSAGNGSLMRTGAVALAHLDDPERLAASARAISALTHVEDIAQEACAVWCLMIRHAVLTGSLPAFADIAPWVRDAPRWEAILSEAETQPPSAFHVNGWAVGALQAAWSAIHHTPVPDGTDACRHLQDALGTAIRIGNDTDTVAAIAGAMLGARWGASAVPAAWRRILHGWPGLRAGDLEQLAFLTARGAVPGKYDWPVADLIDYTDLEYGRPALVLHPHDAGVYLASASALDRLPADVDVVISLCLTGRRQVPTTVEHLTFRLMDEPAASENPNLDFVLADTAVTIASLRDEGKVVLVHCVAAHSRTPTVGVAYSLARGHRLGDALPAVCAVLPAASPNSGFVAALRRGERHQIGTASGRSRSHD